MTICRKPLRSLSSMRLMIESAGMIQKIIAGTALITMSVLMEWLATEAHP